MAGINFTNKKLRYAKDLHPDEMPPVVGKRNVLENYDRIMIDVPLQKGEDKDARSVRGKE